MTLQVGNKLSHYCLLEQIGEGGMGVVWNAGDTRGSSGGAEEPTNAT